MPAPSGFENFRNVFVVVRSLPGDRLNIVNIFGLGQLALDDAARRFIDTGGEYTVFNASGLAKRDVLNVINNNIGGITSGIVSQLRFNLDINADDDNITHGILFDIPMAEWKTNQVSRWNLKTPVGGVSGIIFDMSWFAEKDDTGEMKFDLSIKQIPSGQDVSTPITSTATMKDTQSFLKNILNIQSVNVEATIPGLEDISLEVKRNDSLTTKIRAISYGVIFKSSGVS